MPSQDTKSVKITDQHTVNLILAEQKRRGDLTAARTANNLINERCTQLGTHDLLNAESDQPSAQPAA